jgi:hypothetical protein
MFMASMCTQVQSIPRLNGILPFKKHFEKKKIWSAIPISIDWIELPTREKKTVQHQ